MMWTSSVDSDGDDGCGCRCARQTHRAVRVGRRGTSDYGLALLVLLQYCFARDAGVRMCMGTDEYEVVTRAF